MDLISTLAAGVNGAESGHASLFKRGTSTRANWFEDFEGTSQISDGKDIDLDQYGGALVYVNEYVDVFIYDDQGTLVRQVTQGHSAPVVEYRGPSFKGTDYAGGAAAINKPITVKDALDLWDTSAGAPDFQVDIGGTAENLTDAFGPTTEMWFNVKDPDYGAKGDGSTDDTTAINAAITAAGVNGGIVYFPPGTYRVVSALTLDAKANMLGAGPNSVVITMDSAAAHTVEPDGSSVQNQLIQGIKFVHTQANSGQIIRIPAATSNLLVRDCVLGDGVRSNGDLVKQAGAASTKTVFDSCRFVPATEAAVDGSASTQYTELRGCEFAPPATYNPTNGAFVYGQEVNMFDCRFVLNGGTSGTYSCFKSSSTTLNAQVHNCLFGNPAGATVTGIELGTYVAASRFVESGNLFSEDSDFTAYSYTATVAEQGARVLLYTRENRLQEFENNDATVTLDAEQYGRGLVKRTGDTSYTLNVSGNAPEGAHFSLIAEGDPGSSTATVTFKQVIETGTINIPGFSGAGYPGIISAGRFTAASLVSMVNAGGPIIMWTPDAAILDNVTT